MVVLDINLPEKLGALLYQPKPDYIAKHIANPTVVFQFGIGTGETVQLDRYHNFADQDADPSSSLNQDARERTDTQTLGNRNSRNLTKDSLTVFLKEFTGPADINNPSEPASIKFTKKKLLTAQRKYYEVMQGTNSELMANNAFHDSLGSAVLLDDFKRWEDRVYINEWLTTQYYSNPDAIADGATVDIGASTKWGGAPIKWQVRDSERIVTDMLHRLCPRFEGGLYRCLTSPRFIYDMRQDDKFMEIVRYSAGDVVPATSMIFGGAEGAPPQISMASAVTSVNQPLYLGGVQTGFGGIAAGVPLMPKGFIFDGVHYFMSTNMPTQSVTMNWSNAVSPYTSGSSLRTAELAIFFGDQSIGIGLGGEVAGAQILQHSDTDWERFIALIWQMYGAYKLLDERFVTVGRSFQT